MMQAVLAGPVGAVSHGPVSDVVHEARGLSQHGPAGQHRYQQVRDCRQQDGQEGALRYWLLRVLGKN